MVDLEVLADVVVDFIAELPATVCDEDFDDGVFGDE